MNQKRDKRGMFFTFITIALLSIFIFSFTVYKYRVEKMSSIEVRVSTMDSFLNSFERDADRAAYITTYRAFIALCNYIAFHGQFLTDVDKDFSEAFFNGTVDGVESELLMASTFPEWQASMIGEAYKLNINLTFYETNATLSQVDPWHIAVNLTLNFSLEDKAKVASWNKYESLLVLVDIEGLEDPLYIINTGGVTTNLINITPYEGNYVVDSDVSNLADHSENSLYAANENAPSYLMRMEGSIGPSVYGIESMVNVQELSELGNPNVPVYQDRSCIDYLYFYQQTDVNYITGMPSWFILDDGHLEKYQVE